MKRYVIWIALICALSNTAFADVQMNIDNSLNWLLTSQNPDASFGNQPDLIFRDTHEVLQTLNTLNQKGSQFQNALQWSVNTKVGGTDFIARKIMLLSNSGSDTAVGLNLLLSDQNADGGWGLAQGQESDCLDTGFALIALKTVNYSDQTIRQSGINYLLSTMNTDGGWGFYSGDDSNVYMTALVSFSLQQFTQSTTLATAVNKATSYLKVHQNTDGGFGSSPSTVYETALAYESLANVITDATVLGNAVNYLTTTQSSDGSWGQDPYSTALALKALHISESRQTPPSQPPTEISPTNTNPSLTSTVLTGKVFDAVSQTPIPNADVFVVGTASSTKTDTTGAYTLASVTALTFTVKASATGYNSQSYNVTTTSYGTYAVEFALTQSQASDLRINSLTTNKQSYSANEDVLITAIIENTGSTAISTVVQAQIDDNQGTIVALTTPANPDTTNLPFWVITIEPSSSVTVTMLWNTAQFMPGAHQIDLKATEPVMHSTIYIPGNIFAEQVLPISIQPFVGIANSAVKCNPTFVYTGAVVPLTIGLTLANQSNIPADLTIQYDVKSPSGAVLASGSTSASLSLDMITTTIPLTELNQTFTESGEYPIHAIVYHGGTIINDVQTAFVVLSNIRIEPTRTVTPNVLLPNETGKVTTIIQLSGKGENSTTQLPVSSTINVPLGYKTDLFASGLTAPISIKVNGNNEIYVAESTKDRILKVTPDGSVSVFAVSGPGTPLDFAPGYPERMDVDKYGNLYFGCAGWYYNPYNPYGDLLDTIYKITPDGLISTLARMYISSYIFNDIMGVAVSPDGELYLFVGNIWWGNNILKINLLTNTATQFAASVHFPTALRFDKEGNLFACMNNNIYSFAPDGTRTVFNDTLAYPWAIAWGPDGLLYVIDSTTKAIYTINPSTKAVTLFATGFTAPYDLDFDSQGNLYVLEYGSGQIIKIINTAAVFTNVRLIDTIPAKDVEFVLPSATRYPFSVTTTGEDTVVEWRFDRIVAGQDQTVSFDLNLSSLIPGEDRIVDHSLQLIYKDLNNQEVTVNLSPVSVHVLNFSYNSALSTDKALYQTNENAVLNATIINLSDFARTTDVKVRIEDSTGNLVKEVATLPSLTFNAGEVKNLDNFVFNTGTTYAGDYKAHLVLFENQIVVGETFTTFTIQPTIAISSNVTTDKLSYNANETATIASTIKSLSTNTILNYITAKISIQNPVDGSQLYTESKPILTLVPGASFAFKSYWNTGTYPPGAYPVTLEVKDAAGALITAGTTTVTITNVIKPSVALKGSITVDKQSLLTGAPVAVSYSVTNIGNVDLPNIGLSALTVNVVNQTVYDTITSQASITMGGTFTGSGQITTQNYSARDYLVILQAGINGTTETLAGTYFRVEGAPSVPSLSLPANGSDVETFTPALVVNNASDPNDDKLTYEFEVYGDSGLASLVTSTTTIPETTGTTAWTVPLSLTENQTYFWRSRAYDGKLYGDWMSSASFRVNTVDDPPTAPTVSSPADNGVVDTLIPVLVVNNASDPDSSSLTYNYDIALDPDFTQIVASKTGVFEGMGTTSWQVPTSLTENTTYYWRCQADDWLITGPWMPTATFFVNIANDAPSKPAIIAPVNNAEVTTLSPDIVITNCTDPDSPVLTYFFELDTVPTFDSPVIIRSGSITQGQNTTTWQATGLQDNTQYYVRAKANDGQTDSGWSDVSAFFVNTVNDPPTAPVLANPSDGAGVNVFTPALSVHNSTDPDKDVLTYEFEVYADAALTTLVAGSADVGETAQITSWTVSLTLIENRTYYWRARAFDGKLHGPWMPTTSFMVNTANDAPGAPMLFSPLDGSSVATLTPTLSVTNAVDPDSTNLTYSFEVYSGTTLVTSVINVPAGSSGMTSITLGAPLTDNTIYQWRARAYDGDRYGAWMAMATFTVHVSQMNVNATINFDPNTLNKTSNGNWVTVFIELPAGYKVADIVVSSIRLEGTIPAELWPYAVGDYDKDGIPDLMVKFKRSDVINLLPNGEQVTVHVTGKVGTTTFEGVDIIRVMK